MVTDDAGLADRAKDRRTLRCPRAARRKANSTDAHRDAGMKKAPSIGRWALTRLSCGLLNPITEFAVTRQRCAHHADGAMGNSSAPRRRAWHTPVRSSREIRVCVEGKMGGWSALDTRAGRHSQPSPTRHQQKKPRDPQGLQTLLVPAVRIELTTYRLQGGCSTN